MAMSPVTNEKTLSLVSYIKPPMEKRHRILFMENRLRKYIWLSPEKLSKDRLKLSLKRRLQDLHIQSFQNFLKENENLRKCTIVNICTKETYSTSDYLSHINSPRIRSIFTKLRTDSKCSKDSSCRRYRGKKSHTDLCPHCNVTQDVQHIILACDHPAVKANRENFLARYAKYVKSFDVDTSRNKLRELLNLDPSCAAGCKEPAQKLICAFGSFHGK